MPKRLRDWDSGVNPFGKPWVTVCQPSDGAVSQNQRRAAAIQGRQIDDYGFSVSCDPGIKAMFTSVITNTGKAVVLGAGVADDMAGKCWIPRADAESRCQRRINHEVLTRTTDQMTSKDIAALTKQVAQELPESSPDHKRDLLKIQQLRDLEHRVQEELHLVALRFFGAFDNVIMPWFDTKDFMRRGGSSELSKMAKQKMSFVAHGNFRQKLMRSRGDPITPHNTITWQDEAYSTCVCSLCDSYCNPGRSRVFKCHNYKCGVRVDRDINGALGVNRFAVCAAASRVAAREDQAPSSPQHFLPRYIPLLLGADGVKAQTGIVL